MGRLGTRFGFGFVASLVIASGCDTSSGGAATPCTAYLTCIEEVGRSSGGVAYQSTLDQARAQYGAGGACEQSAQTRSACDSSCTQALAAAHQAFPSVSACGSATSSSNDGGAPTATGAPECDRYLECAAQVVPMSVPQLLSTYGPNGTCWSTSAAVRQTCITSCTSGLSQLLQSNPDEPKCGGTPSATFCKNTNVANSCARDFFYDLSTCFSPMLSTCRTDNTGGAGNVCFSSGEKFSLVGNNDTQTATWKDGATVCATGVKDYSSNSRTLTITRGVESVFIDFDNGELTCSNGAQESFSQFGSGCAIVDAIVGVAFPEWRDNECTFGTCP